MSDPALGPARDVLRRYFGYSDFRPLQRKAVAAVLTGRDAVVVLPTGGGKSICFQVPALLLPGTSVVVSPLISLMADQVQALHGRGIAADFLNSTLTVEETARRVARLQRGETKLLYLAPERLVVGHTASMLRCLTVPLLAVDEAHCVSIWGQEFRPSYSKLAHVRQVLGNPQTVALTATATPVVRADIVRLLGLRAPIEVVGGFDRPNLRFAVRRVRREETRREILTTELRRADAPAVVYAATRAQVEGVTRMLGERRIPAVPYHGGMDAERRARAQDAFMSGSQRIIVATNAFGMGIDKPDVRLVAHYAMSGSLEDYYQEAGRAGRDGGVSRCLLLHHPADRAVHDALRQAASPAADEVRLLWDVLVDRPEGECLLDPADLSRDTRFRLSAQKVERSIGLLADAGLLHRSPDPGTREARLLATRDRIALEEHSLTRQAGRLVHLLLSRDAPAQTWLRLDATSTGMSVLALDRALGELASSQLVHALAPVATAQVSRRDGADARLAQLLRTLQRRQRAERAKLDAMAGYAITRGCRRHFILRYFGDQKAAFRCETCDNCAG